MAPKVRKNFLKGKPKASPVTDSERDDLIQKVNKLTSTWRTRLSNWKCQHQSSQGKITLVSDCCGYGSELIALRLLGLQKRIHLAMATEVDGAKVDLHEAVSRACGINTSSTVMADMFERDLDSAPQADIYVAGYPCPSFSKLGRKKGTKDRRGLVTLKGLEFIAFTRPKMVLLEQVATLLHKSNARLWQFIQKTFRILNYQMIFQVLNTKHFGVPQSRPRVYIIAIVQECAQGRQLEMPPARKPHPDLHQFLDKNKIGKETLNLPNYEEKIGPSLWTKGYIVDVGSSPKFQHALTNCCPCLTYTRLKEGGYYIPKLRRRVSCEEAARLQGVPAKVLAAMRTTELPPRSVDAALGDAMSINVLMLTLRRGLDVAGLTDMGPKHDWWLRCPSESCHQLSDNLFDKYG